MVEQSSKKLYVPALKWRKGEKTALKELNEGFKRSVLPLIELVNDEGDNPEDLSKDISTFWGKPTYLDVYHRPPHFARFALENVTKHTKGIDIIPVIRLNSPQIVIDGVKDVVGMYNNGFAIRIVVGPNINYGLLEKEIALLKGQLPVENSKIDIIIDFGYIDGTVNYESTLRSIKSNLALDSWRRVIIAGGTFPLGLLDFKPDKDNFLDRSELKLWQDNKHILGRDSVYSDYTVRGPENIIKQGRGSKSVRYTLKTKFQVFRGTLDDGTYKYLVHAANIRELYSSIYSKTYSWGDKFIKEKADQLLECLKAGIDPETYPDFSTGSPTEWIAASINHHMTVVLKDNLNS